MLTTTSETIGFNKLRGCSCQCQAATAAREVLSREFKLLLSKRPSKRVLVLESPMTDDELAGPWDYIFSAGLFSNLSDHHAKDVLHQAVNSLNPCGVLILANVKPNSQSKTCGACAASFHFARDEQQLAALGTSIPGSLLAGQLVFGDESGVNAYLELSAAPARACPDLVGVIRTAVQ